MKGTHILFGKNFTLSLITVVVLLTAACFNIVLVEPQPMPEEPPALLGEPSASVEEPPALLGEPSASVEEPPALLGEPSASVEEPSALLGKPPATVEGPSALLDGPPATVEELQPTLDEPPALNDVLTVMPVSGDLKLLSEFQASNQEINDVDAPGLESATDIFVSAAIPGPSSAIAPEPLPVYQLSVNGMPAIESMLAMEGGTVEVSLPPRKPAGFYWGGDQIHLTAIPEEGFQFDAWGGDCSSDGNVCVLTIDGNKDFSAGFVPLDESFGLELGAVPDSGGEVEVHPSPNAPDGRYANGTLLELKAIDSAGFGFTGWHGACVGEDRECRIVMNSNKSVTASFAPDYYTLTINRVLVDADGVSVSHGQIEVFPFIYAANKGFAQSAIVSLMVDPDAGYVVVHWGGDCSEVEPGSTECTLNMDGDKLVEVTFAEEAAANKS